MGLFFTLFYILTAYVAVDTLFGDLAQYHIEVIVAIITLLFSLFSAAGSQIARFVQSYALVALCAAVFLSLVFNGWFGGGVPALMEVMPRAITFYFIILNCKKKSHLQMVVAAMVLGALWTVAQGVIALHSGDPQSPFLVSQESDEEGVSRLYRIRGLSFINDPNDLAQFLVGLVPCTFFFWRKGRTAINFALVLLPVSFMVYGMFLTHSRGGMVALLVACIVAGRRKIGIVKSVVAGIVLFIGLSAAGWSGGRSMDAESGADRMSAWATGLELVRAHPIFGVGFKGFTDYNEITAHNTIVVLAAEIGMVGLFCWILFVLPTLRDAFLGSKAMDRAEKGEKSSGFAGTLRGPPQRAPIRKPGLSLATAEAGAVPLLAMNRSRSANGATFEAPSAVAVVEKSARRAGFIDPMSVADATPHAEIRRLMELMLISFAGFLTAGWFLSRAYTMMLFINAGMVEVLYRIGLERGIVPPAWEFTRAMKMAAIASLGLIALVYILLRVTNLLGGGK